VYRCPPVAHHRPPPATHGRAANNTVNPEPLLYTIPQLLGSASYITHAIGKMHFRPQRRHHGFQRMELMEEIPPHREDDEYLQYLKANGYGHVRQVHGVRNLLYHQPQVSVVPEAHHGSTWVADRTVDSLPARAPTGTALLPLVFLIAPSPALERAWLFASMYPIEVHRSAHPLGSAAGRCAIAAQRQG
jgi:arylsulfatase A-like enzyme